MTRRDEQTKQRLVEQRGKLRAKRLEYERLETWVDDAIARIDQAAEKRLRPGETASPSRNPDASSEWQPKRIK